MVKYVNDQWKITALYILFIACFLAVTKYSYIITWHIYITYAVLLACLMLFFYLYEKILILYFLSFMVLFWFGNDLYTTLNILPEFLEFLININYVRCDLCSNMVFYVTNTAVVY